MTGDCDDDPREDHPDEAAKLHSEARDAARLLERLHPPCRGTTCFYTYRAGDPSPWVCPVCGQRWLVRDGRWERVGKPPVVTVSTYIEASPSASVAPSEETP